MQFIDLAAQQKRIREKIEANLKKVLDHGAYIMGPEVSQLERTLGEFCGTGHAISCASGTDALLMALMAYGVKPGDAVFTTPFTFIATAEVISLLGATPVFVDIDPATFNIDPAKLDSAIRALKSGDPSIHPLPSSASGPSTDLRPLTSDLRPLTSDLRPKGIIPVDLFGLTADYDAIEAVAKRHDLFVIEDAAQSFGAEYKGKKACSFGDIACTSFFPAKPLGAYGDGGMCFTDDDTLCGIMKSIRVHGQGGDKYNNVRIGINGRLDTLQAAVLLAKFEIFSEEVEMRNRVAGRYTEALSGSHLITPFVPEGYKSAWAQYSVMAENEKERSRLLDRLKGEGIPTAIYYPKPLHLQTAYEGLGYRPGDFPESEAAAKRIFSLPMHPYLTQEIQNRIIASLKKMM